MNLFDFAHSLVTGEWRLQRELVREQREFRAKTHGIRQALVTSHQSRMQLYAGAESGINRPAPNPLSGPEDYKQSWQRIVLIRAARQMEEDYGFFDGLLDDFDTYVVGDELVYLPNTGNDAANKVIREYLEWQFDEADYAGIHDLTKLAQLAIRSVKRDGECAFVPVDVGDAIKLRSISGDCIGNPTIGTTGSPNDFNGIVTNGAVPIRYDVFKRSPKMNSYSFDRSFKPDEFWHYYDPFRLVQYHGVTAFKNAIRDAFDIDQILEFTKLNIKWRSSQLPTVHNETGRPRGAQFGYGWGNGTGQSPTTSDGQPRPLSMSVDGVTTTFMKLDEQVVEYPNDFPNAQLQVSIEELRRQCCKGIKIPYEFAYRADNGGVVQRFWVNKAENTFNRDKRLLRRIVLNRYKNRVIQKGIDTGELDLRSFGDLDVSTIRFRGQWQMGRQISVDYGRETDADLKLIDAGLMSEEDKVTDAGGNLEEIRAQKKANTLAIIRDAQDISKSTGLPVDQVLPFMVKKWPNPPSNPVQIDPAAPVPSEAEAAAREARDTMRADQAAEKMAAKIFSRMPALPAPAPAPPPNITIHNQPPAVTVNPSEVKIAPAVVNVQHHSHLAAAPSPQVTVNMPKPEPVEPAAPPVVNVNVPPAAPPVVNVTVPPLNATLTIERGSDGKMNGGKIS